MTVHYEVDGPVAVVTIDRPEARNAVDGPTAEALVERVPALRRRRRPCCAAVLTGAGGTFCAGADLKAMSEPGRPRANRVATDGDGPMGPTRMLLSKPVVAAVEGHAVAGGLELALWCDLRVAAEDAVFGVFCRRWGVPLVDGGTVRLPRIVGQGRALDLVLTGRPVAAGEALAWGSATGSVPDRARPWPRRPSWHGISRSSRKTACGAIGSPCTSSGTSSSRRRSRPRWFVV